MHLRPPAPPSPAALLLAGAGCLLLGACMVGKAFPAPATAAARAPLSLHLPLALVRNDGQWPDRVRFAATSGAARLWLEADAIVLEARRADGARQVFRLRIVGAAPDCRPVGAQRLPGSHNFYLGSDPSRWRTGVPAHAEVRWPAIRPGIDLVLATDGGEAEYRLDLRPGADLAGLLFRCEGAERIAVDDAGALHLEGRLGSLVQSPPLAWRTGPDGRRSGSAVRFRLAGDDTFGFAAEQGAGEGLCIDPMLHWATFVGGSAYEWGYGISRQLDGTVLVAGETTSSDFPTTAGAFDPSYNGSGPPTSDAYVARITADGTGVVYAAYLGGSGGDKAYAVAGNGLGEATVVGAAGSSDFPTTLGAYDRTLGGAADAFVARVSASGGSLVFSTFLGGGDADDAEDVALDPSGNAWVAGVTSSPTFPTTANAYLSSRSGLSDAFVARIASSGAQLLACTLLGGSDGEVAKGIAVAASGNVYVGGVTSSSDFPTTPQAMQHGLLGSSDAFLACFDASCQTLLASTLCGGSSGDVGEAVGITAGGLPLLAGVTSSNDFPVSAGAYDGSPSGSSDAFVAAFDAQLARRFATLIGGSGGDVAKAVFGLPGGTIVVGGQTSSSDFPTTPGATLASGSGSADAFVSQLAADGSGLLCSTLFGGSGSDGGEDADGQDAGAVVLTGVTNSRNMPTGANPWSGSQQGTNDAFAAEVDLRAPGVLRYGTPTPACLGPIGAAVTRWPAANAGDFAFTCIGAPPFGFGLLVLGFTPAPGLPVFGITAWLDPTGPLLTSATFADPLGFARVPLPLSGVGAGTHFYVQFVWFDPPGCGPAGGLGASDALDITVQ